MASVGLGGQLSLSASVPRSPSKPPCCTQPPFAALLACLLTLMSLQAAVRWALTCVTSDGFVGYEQALGCSPAPFLGPVANVSPSSSRPPLPHLLCSQALPTPSLP